MQRVIAVILIAFAFRSPPVTAQRLPAPLFTHPVPAEASKPTPTYVTDDFDGTKAAFAGILGAVGGLAAGALIGHQFDTHPCDDCAEFALLGAFTGATVGAPLAVHLSNQRRGRLGPAILASFGIGIGTFAAARAVHDARLLLAVPILQVASAITIERHTARD